MTIRNMDGQMDFLGLINEYTDSQGAVVRVREPGRRRFPESRASDFEQLSFEFGTVISDAEPLTSMQAETIITNEEVSEEISIEEIAIEERTEEAFNDERIIKVSSKEKTSEKEALEKETLEKEALEKETLEKETLEIEALVKEASENALDETTNEEILEKTSEEASEKECSEGKTVTEPSEEALEEKTSEKNLLFKQCVKCWCFDCKHNSRNGGVPREICGTMMACPACNDCISEDMATICEIGNAKEGCRTRALEEGIIYEEEFTEG